VGNSIFSPFPIPHSPFPIPHSLLTNPHSSFPTHFLFFLLHFDRFTKPFARPHAQAEIFNSPDYLFSYFLSLVKCR
jgi:hypothetical protein